MKKLYLVEIKATAVVLADSVDQARREAMHEARDIIHSEDDPVFVAGEITSTHKLPNGWDGGCIPYGDKEDKTIDQYLK